MFYPQDKRYLAVGTSNLTVLVKVVLSMNTSKMDLVMTRYCRDN